MLPELARRLLYVSGVLGLYHRVRNADTLTVAMFHRVLDPDDRRWQSCDPDYTLSTELLAQSLRFFKRHYHVVSLPELLAARRGEAPLPPRALLVTFDDGWADNAEFALPELQRAGLPALLFVVADAVGQRQPFFQEQLVAAWRRGALDVSELALSMQLQTTSADGLAGLRVLIAQLECLDPVARDAILARFADVLDDGARHMVDVPDLQRLQCGGVALGLHGKTHAPLTAVPDLDAELAGAREALAGVMNDSADKNGGGDGDAPVGESMSFPHGAYDDAIARRAHESGYELVFTSIPVLNPVGPSGTGWLLGRTGFEASTVVDSRGRFRPERLALYLFRRERRRLA